MKPWSSVPLAWTRVVIASLLVTLAVTVLIMTRRIERIASLIEIDSVPGLVEANRIRATCSEEFTMLVQAVDEHPQGPVDPSEHFVAFDRQLATSVATYRRTIHIDPTQDNTLLDAVLAARESYIAVRTEVRTLLAANRIDNAQSALANRVAPAYRALIQKCDALVAYNSGTGTVYAGRMASIAATLRLAALGTLIGVCAALVIFLKTLTRQLRVERELHESGEKLALAFRVSPHSMVISRRSDGKIIAANDAFRRHYGITHEDLTRYTTVEAGVWKSDAERDGALQEIQATGRLANYVKKRQLADGTVRTLLVSAEPITLAGAPCLLSVGQDITERVKAQEALERSEAELRTIFESAANGIALVADNGHPIRTNPALQRFLGYSADEFRGMSFAQFTHPDEAGRDVQLFGQLLRGELASYHIEKRYIRKDGEVVWGHLTASVVRPSDPQPAYVIAMVEDITDRKRAELALRESEQARQQLQQQLIVAQKLEALGQLAGGVAHDFNNILAAITLNLEAIKLAADSAGIARSAIDELIGTARSASRLTRQLLLFSRREPARREWVDLDQVIATMMPMLERLIGRQLALVHVHPPHPVRVFADIGMMEQVVMNLVVNARDAMPGGGRIELKTDETMLEATALPQRRDVRPGRYLRLVVTDTGIGMSPETMQRIFEPFFTTKPVGKGTGLGLSTVFGIVKQHDGWIDVASVEGKGTSFTIYLPTGSAPDVDGATDVVRIGRDRKSVARGNYT